MKNRFSVGIINLITDYNVFKDIYVSCSKYAVSRNMQEIPDFPNLLLTRTSNNQLDVARLKDFITTFNILKESIPLPDQITKSFEGKLIINIKSKRGLAKKRKIQRQIANDAYEIISRKYALKSKELKNAISVFYRGINSNYLTYPPTKIGESRFANLLSKLSEEDAKLISTIYKQEGQYYYSENRISKKNFEQITKIIFLCKHC